MCYQPGPAPTERVAVAIPSGYTRGYYGVTHVPSEVVWDTLELLQCHVAAWELPREAFPAEALASHRLLAATARLLARYADASAQEWTASDGAMCAAHLARLEADAAPVQDGQPTAALADEDAEEDDEGDETPETASTLLGAYAWLSRALEERGVDVPDALEAATATGKE